MAKKLFIPGPVEVDPEILRTMATPMFGHRSKEYGQLHSQVRDRLKRMLNTQHHVFLCTASSTGAMEAAVRNLVRRRVLSTACGAFSERWHGIAEANGKSAHLLSVNWGRAIHAEQVREALRSGDYDAVTVVHNETSTGVMNRLDEIAEVMKEFPDVMFLVDAVSSMAAAPLELEQWRIDCCFAGVQKGFGLPPGLTVIYVSDRALRKAKTIPNRGYYFDLCEMADYDAKDQTPTTPALSQIVALNHQLDRMLARGMPAVYQGIRDMAMACRAWAVRRFELFPEPGYESVTMTAVRNTRGVPVSKMVKLLEERHGVTVSDGYGKIKGETFRIGHMGQITQDDLTSLLSAMDDILDHHL